VDTGTGGSPGGSGSRPATMQDIAAATGVSRSTVSRILNDVPLTVPIAQETRERVLATAHELGYLPKPRRRRSTADR
jgi:DNA-binding LacI/PurR family transcriptional regulator